MNETLLIFGKIAGIGGLALGVLLIVFRDVIRKNVFPTLTKSQGYNLLKLSIVLVWTIGLAGIASWTYVAIASSQSQPSAPSGPYTVCAKDIGDIGAVVSVTDDGGNLIAKGKTSDTELCFTVSREHQGKKLTITLAKTDGTLLARHCKFDDRTLIEVSFAPKEGD